MSGPLAYAEDSVDRSSSGSSGLFERAAERKIAVDDLNRLKVWPKSEPDAPEGRWFKDFGSFKLCGEGKYPKTFLLRGQVASEEEL